jgi:tetratricopeptide (TPR) repeat protein
VKPPTYEAYREFLEGMQAKWRSEDKKALKYFSRAVELDSDFIMAVFQKGYTYLRLGKYVELELLVRELDKSRDKLIPANRYQLDYFDARVRGDHEAAYNARIQMAIALGQPKEDVKSIVLGLTASRINRPKEAIAILKRCDPESGQGYCTRNARKWWGYWWALTTAHHMLGNHEQELKEARRGRKYHPEKFRTLVYELRALSALGQIKEVNKLIDESLTLPPQRRRSPGWVMRWTAQELRAHGYRQASLQVIEQAVKWFESRTKKESKSRTHRDNLAQVLYEAERWEKAQDIYEALHKKYPDRMKYLGQLGVIAVRRGDREEALRISSLLESINKPYIFGSQTYWRARIASILGERENAVKFLREALAQGRVYYDLHPVIDFEPLQDYQPFKELIKPKG